MPAELIRKKIITVLHWKLKGEPENVIFEVSDNGIGMDRETREKALSMFFSSKGSGGTGLGLFIANKIAESHGGKINIESEADKGSKFIVTMMRSRPIEALTENQKSE